jgi:hypothetical protein
MTLQFLFVRPPPSGRSIRIGIEEVTTMAASAAF